MRIVWVLGLILCGTLWYLFQQKQKCRTIEVQRWRKEALLAEVEGVVRDFLDHGKGVVQATGGAYRGVLSLRFHSDPETGEGFFCVSMYDSGDLGVLDPDTLEACRLTGFVERYGYFYDPERNALVYETAGGVYFQPGEEGLFQQMLLHRIQKHPLAVMKSDTVISTWGI